MAVNYSTAVKTDRMQAVVDAIDGGAGAGTLEICTAAYASVLAIITLNDPCGTVSNGVITFSGTPLSDASANATGTAALARFKDSNGTVCVDDLTVGTGSEDVVLDNTSINTGQTVTISSASLTHAADT